MEAVLFIGIQAVGKSTFFKERFFNTHIRLNMDMLHTRHRESLLLNACFEAKQPFVVDNTNPTIEERARYIQPAKAQRFQVVGYYFQSAIDEALRRNALRSESERIPEIGVRGTFKRLQQPSAKEGFDTLYYVKIDAESRFTVSMWEA